MASSREEYEEILFEVSDRLAVEIGKNTVEVIF